MPNRTEILHFRATPEEKETIRENAGHAELALSEWMRQRSLDRLIPTQHRIDGELYTVTPIPTQPAVEVTAVEPVDVRADPRHGFNETLPHHRIAVDTFGTRDGETYKQFMERRVPELLGQDVDAGDVESAQLQARAEWAANEP